MNWIKQLIRLKLKDGIYYSGTFDSAKLLKKFKRLFKKE